MTTQVFDRNRATIRATLIISEQQSIILLLRIDCRLRKQGLPNGQLRFRSEMSTSRNVALTKDLAQPPDENLTRVRFPYFASLGCPISPASEPASLHVLNAEIIELLSLPE